MDTHNQSRVLGCLFLWCSCWRRNEDSDGSKNAWFGCRMRKLVWVELLGAVDDLKLGEADCLSKRMFTSWTFKLVAFLDLGCRYLRICLCNTTFNLHFEGMSLGMTQNWSLHIYWELFHGVNVRRLLCCVCIGDFGGRFELHESDCVDWLTLNSVQSD